MQKLELVYSQIDKHSFKLYRTKFIFKSLKLY